MYNTKLLNLAVKHRTFGSGVITEVDEKNITYITVQFNEKSIKFIYPDAFGKYVMAEDSLIQAEIMADIAAKRQEEEEKRQAAEAARQAAEEQRLVEGPVLRTGKVRKSTEEGFGPDYHVQYLARESIFTYQQVEEQFGINITGFGRGINETASAIVLISSVDRKKTGFVYHDHWTADGDYIYSGEGKTGDQKMTSGNQALKDTQANGKPIHLFVKFSPREYYYQGVFFLVDCTREEEKDALGNVRQEWKFILRKQPIKEENLETVRVVAAVIYDSSEHGTRVFAAARGYGEFKGKWEFPGGKIEPGETPNQALVREIKEELDVKIEVGEFIGTIEHDYPTFHLSMDCFWCSIVEGEIVLKEAEAAKWIPMNELPTVDWLPADRILVEKVSNSASVDNPKNFWYTAL